jgi:hypothetical protein
VLKGAPCGGLRRSFIASGRSRTRLRRGAAH